MVCCVVSLIGYCVVCTVNSYYSFTVYLHRVDLDWNSDTGFLAGHQVCVCVCVRVRVCACVCVCVCV